MLAITKKYTFSAAHRLWNPDFSEAENAQHFGACVKLHGHNYTLEVTVAGKPVAETGMILPLDVLNQLVTETLLVYVDHQHLDEDVPFLAGQLSTVENVAQVFYQRLADALPPTVWLHRLRLYETELNSAVVTHEGNAL